MERKKALPLAHWGLDRWPFRSAPDPGQFYPTVGHNEALARIDYLADSRRRVGVLLGESGVGKSMVLRVAAGQLARKRWQVVAVDALGATTRELFWQIACGLKTTPREDADVAWLWRQIADRVAEHRMQQLGTVLLVDDAGQAGPDVVMQLARLARLDAAATARWTMVLAAEPAQAVRWNDTLRNLVDLRIDVSAWNREETVGYVQTSLVEAGRFEPVFEDDALVAVHELAAGVPRQVARLADFAMVAGAAAGAEMVDAAIVEAANDEIAWPAVARAY